MSKDSTWLWILGGGAAAAGLAYVLSKQGGSPDATDDDPAIYTVGQATGLTQAEAYIIKRESNGNPLAQNSTSTAFGLGQLLIANRKMYGSQLGIDANTVDPNEQLMLFRAYVEDRYGDANAAMDFWVAHNWY